MKRKKVLMTLEAEPYERLQALAKLLGYKKNWFALEVDKLVKGLVYVAEQAMKDAEERKEMTEEVAMKRYEDMMRKFLGGQG